MDNTLLSICISSYNHGDKCAQLVKSILSVEDERFNIVICDDCSNKDTTSVLETLSDSRVKIIYNKNNLGPCKNWFETINSGNGRYILHLLDRDVISIAYLSIILNILENNKVGGGYFGKSEMHPVKEINKKEKYVVCNKGRDAFLTMAGVPVHPTGFFVERTLWKNGKYKKYFYDSKKYGIYPHSYVLGELAVKHDMIYSPIPFYSYTYRGSNKKSNFYQKEGNEDYWWVPDNIMSTGNRLMLYLSKIADDLYRSEFICRRFKDTLERATITYKKVAANQQEMEHYGLDATYIYGRELLYISVKYKMVFGHMLKKMKLNNNGISKKVRNIWAINLGTILQEMSGKPVNKVLALSNKNNLQFQMMNEWVRIKQKEKNLSAYFEERGYYYIAIYGMGIIGQTLLDELKNSSVSVVCGIDRKAEMVYSEVEILSPSDKLPQVDIVVVTVIESFDKIAQDLQERISSPIISLRDIVYDI